MDRREFLSGSGLVLSASLFGCRLDSAARPSSSAVVGTLIDAHCHVFNGSDLPTVRFIKVVLLKNYPKQATRVLDIKNEDAVDQLINLLLWIMRQTRAPIASKEIAVLGGKNGADLRNQSKVENARAVIGALAEAMEPSALNTSGEDAPPSISELEDALYKAAGPLPVSDEASPQARARVVASRVYHSRSDLGSVFRWFALFTKYRFALADELAATHVSQGFSPMLLCPALVDYDSWLGQNVEKSPLPAQVAVMGMIARRKRGAAVHGYVGFDPLRQARFEAGKFDKFDPLELVRTATEEQGFIGVKLYPPMGFRASGNEGASCQPYPKEVVDELVPTSTTTGECPRLADVGRRLDKSLAALYQYCSDRGVAILAHANDSNGAGEQYSRRADPTYWIDVFAQHPQLHVTLAHFGTFTATADGTGPRTNPPDNSWEWALGKYIGQNPAAPVFMDISYLSEILGQSATYLDEYQKNVSRWITLFDSKCEHLTFGTDWTMLGINPDYGTYTTQVYDFFKYRIGFDDDRLERLFYSNAVRFLGLRIGDKNWTRLRDFYARHDVPLAKLPLLIG